MAETPRKRASSDATLITPKSPQKGDGASGFIPGPAMVGIDDEDVALNSPEARASRAIERSL